MSNEEIIAEIRRRPDCCRELMGTLWQQNEGIVRKVCRKYAGLDEPEDILQEAFLAMWQAVQGFDLEAGIKFTTYLSGAIEKHIPRYLDGNGAQMVPGRIRARLRRYRDFLETYREETGGEPELEEIREATGLTLKEIEAFQSGQYDRQTVSLDAPVESRDGDAASLYEAIADPQDAFSGVEGEIYQDQLSRCLWACVDSLPEKQPEIIRARYQGGLTVEAAGQSCGMTKAEARRTERQALQELQRGKNRRKLSPFYETIRTAAMRGTGVARFNQTWTSATEREALRLYEW